MNKHKKILFVLMAITFFNFHFQTYVNAETHFEDVSVIESDDEEVTSAEESTILENSRDEVKKEEVIDDARQKTDVDESGLIKNEINNDNNLEIHQVQNLSIQYDTIINSNTVDYYGYVTPQNNGIYTAPNGTKDAILYTSYLYNWKDVRITEEAETQKGIFSKLVNINTNSVIGWINKSELYLYNQTINTYPVDYTVKVNTNNGGIYTLPKGSYGAVLYTSYLYNSKDVVVSEEAITSNGVFLRIQNKDTSQNLGWISENDVQIYDTIIKKESTQLYGQIKNANEGIYTQPKGLYNAILYTTYLHNNQFVYVEEQATTESGVFGKVRLLNENRVLGWINLNDLNILDFHRSSQNVQKFGVVSSKNDGIYTEPKGSYNAILYTSYLLNNKVVKIIQESQTINGDFVLLQDLETNREIGWIKKADIRETPFIKSSKTVSLYGKVLSGNKGIYTRPKGDFNSILYTSYLHNNQDVRITEEANTITGSFYKISDEKTSQVLGWINKNDIALYSNLQNVKVVNSYGKVKVNNNGIYTKPRGTNGAKLVTSYIMNNKDIKIIEEASSSNIQYVKITDLSNNLLGWIRKSDISYYNEVLTTKKVDYEAKVLKSNDGIYTNPKGVYGTKLYTSYLYNNKKVRAVEEASTSNGTYVKIVKLEDASILGWIKKSDLLTQKVVFLDAGHGGSDSGASYGGVNEKTINLQVSKKIQTLLEAKGYKVIMSRTSDVFLDHSTQRSKVANASGADIFISVHHNAMPGNSNVNGIETFYYEYDPDYPSKINGELHNDPNRIKESAALAESIHNSLIKSTGAFNRGVRRDTFAVLRETAIPAVLLELGFMSNPKELSILKTDAYQNILANAVVNGIDNYFK